MRLYVTYEETPFNAQGERLVLDENGMKKLYEEAVDKEEYPDYASWLYDMLKSGVFEERVYVKKFKVRYYRNLHIKEMIINAKSREEARRIFKKLSADIEGCGNIVQIQEVK